MLFNDWLVAAVVIIAHAWLLILFLLLLHLLLAGQLRELSYHDTIAPFLHALRLIDYTLNTNQPSRGGVVSAPRSYFHIECCSGLLDKRAPLG
jgi:hypothetical protein